MLLITIANGKVVGVAMVFGRGLARLKGVGQFVMYIRQDYYAQGLGTLFTRRILEEARGKGFHRVGLEVVAGNAAAIKVYERVGLQLEGRLREAFLGDD